MIPWLGLRRRQARPEYSPRRLNPQLELPRYAQPLKRQGVDSGADGHIAANAKSKGQRQAYQGHCDCGCD